MNKSRYKGFETIRPIELEQGSEEWKEFRKMKIGSSTAASILGVGFKTPLQLFEDMIEDRETPVNEAMMRGNRMEPIAREWLNKKYKCNLEPVVLQHPNPDNDWHISSLDGLHKWSDGTYLVCEIKHPGKVDHQKALDGEVPEKYLPQCYHILESIPTATDILYLSFHEDSQAEIWVKRDEEKMSKQFEAEYSFYKKLLSFSPPEPTDKDWISILDKDLLSKGQDYLALKLEIDRLQKEAENLKKEIIENAGFATRAKLGEIKLQKVVRQGGVDYSKIAALKGIDLSPYRKEPVVSWRLA